MNLHVTSSDPGWPGTDTNESFQAISSGLLLAAHQQADADQPPPTEIEPHEAGTVKEFNTPEVASVEPSTSINTSSFTAEIASSEPCNLPPYEPVGGEHNLPGAPGGGAPWYGPLPDGWNPSVPIPDTHDIVVEEPEPIDELEQPVEEHYDDDYNIICDAKICDIPASNSGPYYVVRDGTGYAFNGDNGSDNTELHHISIVVAMKLVLKEGRTEQNVEKQFDVAFYKGEGEEIDTVASELIGSSVSSNRVTYFNNDNPISLGINEFTAWSGNKSIELTQAFTIEVKEKDIFGGYLEESGFNRTFTLTAKMKFCTKCLEIQQQTQELPNTCIHGWIKTDAENVLWAGTAKLGTPPPPAES